MVLACDVVVDGPDFAFLEGKASPWGQFAGDTGIELNAISTDGSPLWPGWCASEGNKKEFGRRRGRGHPVEGFISSGAFNTRKPHG
jgi:hypothetical protein